MALTIELPADAERELRDRAQTQGLSAEGYARLLLERDLAEPTRPEGPTGPLRTAAEIVLRRVRHLPPEAFEGLPEDGAAQHDHYIYGTPKTRE